MRLGARGRARARAGAAGMPVEEGKTSPGFCPGSSSICTWMMMQGKLDGSFPKNIQQCEGSEAGGWKEEEQIGKGLARPTSLASTRKAFKEFEVRVDVIVLVLETHSGWKLGSNAE